jgi:biotin transport system substrate-specific component
MVKKIYFSELLKDALLIVLGILFLISMAFKKLPLPGIGIQMSLQSLSISLLVITIERKAFRVVVLYLALATMSLPVLAGGESNHFWFTSPSAGYYIGFLISSYFLPKLLNNIKPQNFCRAWICLAFNEAIILFSGYIILTFYIGINKAFWMGVWPYIFGALLKISAATCGYILKYSQLKKRELASGL